MLQMILFTLIIVLLVLIWIMLYDSNRFVTKTYAIKDKRIKKNCRAVVLADLHNKTYGKENKQLIEAIHACNPDFIFIAGDLLTARPNEKFLVPVSLLKELVKDYPIYYANGNHEHRLKLYPETYKDMAEQYEEELKKLHIKRLVNEHVSLAEYGIEIYGSEIEREYYKRFRLPVMPKEYLTDLLGTPSGDLFTVLIAHRPDYFPQYSDWGADLTLSGHVHGGVVRVPVWGKGVISPSIHFFPQYDGGSFSKGKALMLLSRGLGSHTIPLRLFNPGELLVVDFILEK